MNERYYGKYRAIVVNNKDPEFMGRIKVQCPKVLGEYESAWCTPCVPCAFNDGGMMYVPSVKEVVWVEFEEGNPSKPIWVGSWWIPNRTPLQKSNTVQDKIMFVSRNQHIIEINDKTNKITILMKDGSMVRLGGGVEITAPTISLNGNVKVNNNLQVGGSISEGGTSLSSKYAPL